MSEHAEDNDARDAEIQGLKFDPLLMQLGKLRVNMEPAFADALRRAEEGGLTAQMAKQAALSSDDREFLDGIGHAAVTTAVENETHVTAGGFAKYCDALKVALQEQLKGDRRRLKLATTYVSDAKFQAHDQAIHAWMNAAGGGAAKEITRLRNAYPLLTDEIGQVQDDEYIGILMDYASH